MTDPTQPPEPDDPLAIIDAMKDYAERLRGMLATLIADGWSEPQARDLVAALMRNTSPTRSTRCTCPDHARDHR